MGDWQQPSQPQVPQAYPGYGQPGYVPPQAARQDNQLALVSLIAGIAAWVIIPFVAAIVAIICGHMARTQIRESNGTQGGDGMAVAGLILGYSHLALSCLGIAFVVLFLVIGVGAAAAGGGM